jgi:hypothetical protein
MNINIFSIQFPIENEIKREWERGGVGYLVVAIWKRRKTMNQNVCVWGKEGMGGGLNLIPKRPVRFSRVFIFLFFLIHPSRVRALLHTPLTHLIIIIIIIIACSQSIYLLN